MYGKIDCTSRSSVSNVKLILWQRKDPNQQGGWEKGAVRSPAGGFTPYTSQSYLVPCNVGWQMHTEMTSEVATPDGSGPENWNSGNKTCA